jgi:hypothetical protein
LALLVSLALGVVGAVTVGAFHEAAYETAFLITLVAAIVGAVIGMVFAWRRRNPLEQPQTQSKPRRPSSSDRITVAAAPEASHQRAYLNSGTTAMTKGEHEQRIPATRRRWRTTQLSFERHKIEEQSVLLEREVVHVSFRLQRKRLD